MRSIVIAVGIVSIVAAPVLSAPCKDPKTGRFATCAPAAKAAVPSPGFTKDARGKCHIATGPKKGKFMACPKGQ